MSETGPSLFRRLVLCRLKLCQTFRQAEDETYLWGECSLCGRQSGIVSREAVRRYMQAQESDEAFDRRIAAEDEARNARRMIPASPSLGPRGRDPAAMQEMER